MALGGEAVEVLHELLARQWSGANGGAGWRISRTIAWLGEVRSGSVIRDVVLELEAVGDFFAGRLIIHADRDALRVQLRQGIRVIVDGVPERIDRLGSVGYVARIAEREAQLRWVQVVVIGVNEADINLCAFGQLVTDIEVVAVVGLANQSRTEEDAIDALGSQFVVTGGDAVG